MGEGPEKVEEKGPLILEVDHLPPSDLFDVAVVVEGVYHYEVFTRSAFKALCNHARVGFRVGQLSFIYRQFDRRDVGPRACRSIADYFNSVLVRH